MQIVTALRVEEECWVETSRGLCECAPGDDLAVSDRTAMGFEGAARCRLI